MYHTIKLAQNKDVQNVVRAAFPDYRKHNATIAVFNGKHNVNSYWSGGSRDLFAIVNLETMQRHSLPSTSHPYFDIVRNGLDNKSDGVIETDHVGNVYLLALPPNCVLVRAGTFCGKPATAYVYVRPDNMPRFFPLPE